MNLIKLTIRMAARRPIIIVLPAILMLLFTVVNSYNPVFPILLGLSSATGTSIFEGLVSTLQLLLDPGILPIFIIGVIGAVIFGSLLMGFILSGYLNVLNNTLAGAAGSHGDFMAGVKKQFTRIGVMTLRAATFAVLLIVFIMVACVPSVIVTRAAATTRPEFMTAAVFVDILTVLVIFFSMMFSRAYLFYWYPAAIVGTKRPFMEGKRFVDKNFWQIVVRFLLFDIVFIVVEFLIFMSGVLVLQLVLNWVFCTLFFTVFTVFILSSYREYSGIGKNEEGQG